MAHLLLKRATTFRMDKSPMFAKFNFFFCHSKRLILNKSELQVTYSPFCNFLSIS